MSAGEIMNEPEPPTPPASSKLTEPSTNRPTNASSSKKRPASAPKETAIYVTGLPPSVTPESIAVYFSKAGILLTDFSTGKPKIKLYLDEHGKVKGDALVVYFRPESVQLAIDLLDETEFCPGSTVRVSRALFQDKQNQPDNEVNSTRIPDAGIQTPKVRKVDKKVVKKRLDELNRKLGWDDGPDADAIKMAKRREKYKRILLLKHMFSIEALEKDPTLIFDLKADISNECERFGAVQNVQLYDAMSEGYVTVKFEEPASVALAIPAVNGRWFDKRRIEASAFDGSIQLKKSGADNEDEEEIQKRLERFSQWIEQGSDEDQEDQSQEELYSDKDEQI